MYKVFSIKFIYLLGTQNTLSNVCVLANSLTKELHILSLNGPRIILSLSLVISTA
jgi:hypothetical protein